MRSLTIERPEITVRHVREGKLTTEGTEIIMRWGNGNSVALEGMSDHLLIRYATGISEDRKSHCDRIDYGWTPCHFGGSKLHFICPQCGHPRMAVFGSAPFACRKCHDLAYPSEMESGAYRA